MGKHRTVPPGQKPPSYFTCQKTQLLFNKTKSENALKHYKIFDAPRIITSQDFLSFGLPKPNPPPPKVVVERPISFSRPSGPFLLRCFFGVVPGHKISLQDALRSTLKCCLQLGDSTLHVILKQSLHYGHNIHMLCFAWLGHHAFFALLIIHGLCVAWSGHHAVFFTFDHCCPGQLKHPTWILFWTFFLFSEPASSSAGLPALYFLVPVHLKSEHSHICGEPQEHDKKWTLLVNQCYVMMDLHRWWNNDSTIHKQARKCLTFEFQGNFDCLPHQLRCWLHCRQNQL